jgi:hypothetical protein
MKNILVSLISVSLGVTVFGGDLAITSLTANGQLTWTNVTDHASYRVEWAAKQGGPWQQFRALTNLDSIIATNTEVTVSIPMFYRVVWTDAPAPQPVGEWDFYGYSAAGSLVATGMISLTNQFSLTNAAGSWVFATVPDGTNTSRLACSAGEAWCINRGNPRFSLLLRGCEFAEGAFSLDGILLGDTFSGKWCAEGVFCSPLGNFSARKRLQPN